MLVFIISLLLFVFFLAILGITTYNYFTKKYHVDVQLKRYAEHVMQKYFYFSLDFFILTTVVLLVVIGLIV